MIDNKAIERERERERERRKVTRQYRDDRSQSSMYIYGERQQGIRDT